MSIFDAFSTGTARIWLQKRVLLWLYVINLLFAAVIVAPYRQAFGDLNKTDLADQFVAGFPVDVAFEYLRQHSLAMKSLGVVALGLGVFYLLFNIFLTGGIVAALSVEHRVAFRRFFHDAARYFWRFLRLFVLLIVVVGALMAGYGAGLNPQIEKLQEAAVTDRAAFLWRVSSVAVLLIVMSLVLMVFDYAKVRTVVERRRSVFIATILAFAFSVRRFWQTIPLFFLNLLILCLLFGVYLVVRSQFSNATTVSLICLFVVQQLFVLSRIWMRLSFFSTQLAYYNSAHESSPSELPAPSLSAPTDRVYETT